MSTYGLDSKDILKLDKGPSSNVVTVIPDSVATDVVALGPALATSVSAGVIPFREAGVGGQLKAVTVTSPITFMNGVLTGPAAATLTSLFPDWQLNNSTQVEAIELTITGMLSGAPGTPFAYQNSEAADFGDFQYGTVAVQNRLLAYTARTTYLVQVTTTAWSDPTTPVLITQVSPGVTAPGRWPDYGNIPCGIIPGRNPRYFNIWFTPESNIVAASEIRFNWVIPNPARASTISDVARVDAALP